MNTKLYCPDQTPHVWQHSYYLPFYKNVEGRVAIGGESLINDWNQFEVQRCARCGDLREIFPEHAKITGS